MTMTEIEQAKERAGNGYRTAKERAAEEIEVMRLKVLGWSDLAIRDEFASRGVSMSLPTIRKRFTAAIAQHGQSTVTEYRELIAQRYELLVRAALKEADNGGGLPAIEAAARITAMYEKLLGVTAPQQVQLEVHQVSEQEAALRDMLAQAQRDEKVRESTIIEGEVVADV